jgi:hypothetical protein
MNEKEEIYNLCNPKITKEEFVKGAKKFGMDCYSFPTIYMNKQTEEDFKKWNEEDLTEIKAIDKNRLELGK